MAPDTQPPVLPADAPTTSRFGNKKLQSSHFKDLKTLESATTAAGEVFKAAGWVDVRGRAC